ncbi:hypothetical protein KUL150_30550 [Alteromonas sp. KUL150]|uniref:DDE-type integrase/transposase/recombinase n=1 Tax=Alteromonas sp. KUL150 TaxID=2480805 RepID=UPI0012E634E4|nr:DDE-type integrase/transposase/recombinase [Alteromonas sp. KUL150]GFD86996.1 hypothetical protein KUL150_30550 [Alteromonas sp. KUL150]
MQANMFKTDTPFRVGDEYYIIQAVHPGKTDTELFCKPYDQETGKPKNTRNAPIFSASELKRMIFNEQACFLDPRSHRHTSMSLTDKQLQQQQMWLDFNYFHIERCGGTRLQANDLVDESIELFNWNSYGFSPYGRSTCQAKISAFVHSEQDPRSLVNWGGASDKGQSRLPEAVELVILECIVEKYLVRKDEKENSKNKVADIIIARLRELKACDPSKYSVVPSKATIYNRFDTLEPLMAAQKQLSKQEQKRLRRKLKGELVGNYPLERVEMDAIYVAIGLLDDDGKTFLGSAVVMVAIDTFTRAVVGYSLDVGEKASESADLAVECIKNAVYEKENPNWPMFGLMTKIMHDASTSITSNLFKRTAFDLGAHPVTVRSHEPWAKPFIERFFLTLRIEFLSELPGYLGSKIFRSTRHLNSDDTLKNHATLTVSEFREKFEEFITDYYHESGHAGLNYRSPNDVWNEQIANKFVPPLPNISNDMDSYRGIQVSERTLYELGYVKIENEIYRDDALKSLWLKGVRKVTVQYSRIGASSVVIPVTKAAHQKALGKSFIIAERRDTSYQPLTSLRSSLNAAREGVNSHLERKGKVRYTFAGGVKNISKKSTTTEDTTNSDQSTKSNPSTFDNTQVIDTDALDAKEQLDKAIQDWASQTTENVTETVSKSTHTTVSIEVGEEL